MVGISGAGMNGPGEADAGKSGGLLSAQARVQYAAMAYLRWRMLPQWTALQDGRV